MKTYTTEQTAKFLALNPTLIGTVLGVQFFEHPTYGDESPLLAMNKSGLLVDTGYYELPSFHEVADLELH